MTTTATTTGATSEPCPVPRNVLPGRCRPCRRGSFAEPGPLPPCPQCGAQRWQMLAVRDLCREAWPSTLRPSRDEEWSGTGG
jgi:hypothetical protein